MFFIGIPTHTQYEGSGTRTTLQATGHRQEDVSEQATGKKMSANINFNWETEINTKQEDFLSNVYNKSLLIDMLRSNCRKMASTRYNQKMMLMF